MKCKYHSHGHGHCPEAHRKNIRFLWPLTGLLALIWVLIRVGPKPQRAMYPCQRVAVPLAASWIASLFAGALAFRKAGRFLGERRFAMALAFAALALGFGVWHLGMSSPPAEAAYKVDSTNAPMGVAKGIHPGRVAWVHDPDVTSWTGAGKWWLTNYVDQTVVDGMLANALRALTEEDSDEAAWDALFRHHNQNRGKGDVGYAAGEKIAIKININNIGSYNDKRNNRIDALPQMVRSLLRQLVHNAGVPEEAITVYDAQRKIGNYLYKYCRPEFPNVKFIGKTAMPGRPAAAWVAGAITYSSDIVNSTARRLPRHVIEAEYLINMPILKAHGAVAGVTLAGKNHFGTCGMPSALHTASRCDLRGMGTYDPQVDLMGHKDLGGKTILYVMDGIYGALRVNAVPSRWSMAPFNGDWPSSIFLSQDPVALDSVGLDFLRTQTLLKNNSDNYLHEAALADAPPSGKVYDPERDGIRLASLGVHEHWDGPDTKQYSRNLGTGDGIELLPVENEMWPELDVLSIADGLVTFEAWHLLPRSVYVLESADSATSTVWTAEYIFEATSSVHVWENPITPGIAGGIIRFRGE
ncbi:MAG: DUF362 domain-containing protein [Kiritimatiellia bacterium]